MAVEYEEIEITRNGEVQRSFLRVPVKSFVPNDEREEEHLVEFEPAPMRLTQIRMDFEGYEW